MFIIVIMPVQRTKMFLNGVVVLALIVPVYAQSSSLIRFGCSQLVTERLDPLVTPGQNPSPHVHQVIGGDSFNTTMDEDNHDLAGLSTCTSCQPADDFSNYWTASMYFRARDGSFKLVPLIGNSGFEQQQGGMTVYYTASYGGSDKVTAFGKGFRMIVGNPMADTREEADQYLQLTYTCLQDINTRTDETKEFPTQPCPAGIMVNTRFPTCWDGVNLDSPDHMSHVAYPESGTFESNGPCPASHPVKVPQLFYEAIFDTSQFNDQSQWPEDGSQPFVWSFGDGVGYGTHGDYMFGWKDDTLQQIMDSNCYVNCASMRTQDFNAMNQCRIDSVVNEEIDDINELPGGHEVRLNARK